MKVNYLNHPCFNDAVRHLHGRIHLPVAPRCNVQCNFCNRKFDCVNESRPGVTSDILSPLESLAYLDIAMEKYNNLSVVGIAGPGDPFANPDETMETLRLIREKHADMLLCVATNGLNLLPYIEELAKINVSHVTITINAIEPEIASKVYSWIRYEKRVRKSIDAAEIFINNQLQAIKELKKHNIIVKINSIIIPDINDKHISAIAKTVAELGADIFNAIPLYQNKESAFSHITEPDKNLVKEIRAEAAKFLPQMHHCTRCRADAVGNLGDATDNEMLQAMKDVKKPTTAEKKPIIGTTNIAVATIEGVLINQHLGEATELSIFTNIDDEITLLEKRRLPEKGLGDKRWLDLIEIIKDCSHLLVSGIGEKPRQLMDESGITIHILEGMIETALQGVYSGSELAHMIKREKTICGQACSGSGTGCN